MFGSNIMSNIACGKFLKNQNTFCKNSDFHVLFGFLARVASLIKLHLLYFLFSKTHFHTFGCEYHTCQPYTNGAFCTPLGLFVLPGGSTLFWFLKCSDCPENTINTRSVFLFNFQGGRSENPSLVSRGLNIYQVHIVLLDHGTYILFME